MLQTPNKAAIRCPVGFSKEIIAVFRMENISIRQKTQNFAIVKVFMQFLANF